LVQVDETSHVSLSWTVKNTTHIITKELREYEFRKKKPDTSKRTNSEKPTFTKLYKK